jgi:hypothetical protein
VSIEPIRPSVSAPDSQDQGGDSGSSLSTVYAAAFGLALQNPQIMGRVPRIDLFTKQRAGVQQAETRRNFRGSILTSLAAIALGTSGYFLYYKQITALEVETNETVARTGAIATQIDQKVQVRHKQEEQYKALRGEGIPVTEIIDYISNSIKPGTGLDQVAITPDLTVTIQGQSVDEAHMIDTNLILQKCPILTDMKLVRFGQLPPEQGVGYTFEMVGKAVSASRIRLPEEKKK